MTKTTKYVISDWTGMLMFGGIEFDTFEEGWEHVYNHLNSKEPKLTDKEFDEWCGEFYVEPVGGW